MSKAFTKEDDESGTALPARSSALVPTERFHLTREGARRLKEHPEAQVRAAIDLADILDPAAPAERALLGVIVHTRNASGDTRAIRLVSHEEQLLLGDGCSPRSPLGRALLGAEVGDVREIVTPRGREELEVLALATEVQPAQTARRAPPKAKTATPKPEATRKPAPKKKVAKKAPAPPARKTSPVKSLKPVARKKTAAKKAPTARTTKTTKTTKKKVATKKPLARKAS